MTSSPTGDLRPAIEILGGAPPAWAGDTAVARDGLAWLVALPGPPRRELLADAWPRRVSLQISAACLEPSWGAGTSRDPLALASAEAILLGWWCQAETVLVTHDLLAEAWRDAAERTDADPVRLDGELPPVICFLPAAEGESGVVPVPVALDGGPPEHLLAILLVRDRPSLLAWDAGVAALFDQAAPGWPGHLSPRVWAAALWSGERGRLTRSAGPVQGWDGDRWRADDESGTLRPGGPARTATRLALSLVATIADDPGRVRDLTGPAGPEARLAA
jgi:hypothetical protein